MRLYRAVRWHLRRLKWKIVESKFLPVTVWRLKKLYGPKRYLGKYVAYEGIVWRRYRFGEHTIVLEGVWRTLCRGNSTVQSEE